MPSFASVRSVSSATNPPAFVKYYPLTNSLENPTGSQWITQTTPPATLKFISRKGFVTRRNDPITDMSYMFTDVSTFNDPDISSWDTSSVTDMSYLFVNATAFDQDLSGWNTTNMTLDTIPVDFATGTSLPTRKFPLFGRDGSQLKYYPMTNSGANDPTYSSFSGLSWRTSFRPSSATWIANRGYITDLADPITNMRTMFAERSGFNDPDLQYWDVSSVTNMSGMFESHGDFNTPIGDWDVSSVTDMTWMFSNANAFNQDISNWNVSSVTNMKYMLYNASAFNQPIGAWGIKTSSVTDMRFMLDGATAFNQPIGDWDVSSVTDMRFMLDGATSFNQPIGDWDVSSVINMSSMFRNATVFDQDLSGWNVTSMALDTIPSSFATSSQLTTRKFPLFGRDGSQLKYYPMTNSGATDPTNSTWQGSNSPTSATWIPNRGYITDILDPITSMRLMFYLQTTFNDADLQYWDTSSVTDMTWIFRGASAFNADISNWDVRSVSWLNMARMFQDASAFNQDLRWWDVSNAIAPGGNNVGIDPENWSFNTSASWTRKPFWQQKFNYYPMRNTALDPVYVSWRDDHQPASYTFRPYDGIYTAPTDPITNMNFMFYDGGGQIAFGVYGDVNDPDISLWDTSTVTSMRWMFTNADSFNQDISNWDVSSVTNMDNMFFGANSFNQDLSGWCVTNITPEPTRFSTDSPLTTENKPVWGSCP